MKRKNAFGEKTFSFIDKLLFGFRLRKIMKVVNLEGKIIVDTGTGYNAMVLKYIKEHCATKELIAIDMKLDKINLNKIGIQTIEGDLNEGIHISSKVDVVIGTAILEHLSQPEIYLKSVYHSLKEGGILIMTVPSIRAKPVLETGSKIGIFDKIEINDHKKYYKKQSIIKLLTACGFKEENIKHEYFQCFMNNFVYAIKK